MFSQLNSEIEDFQNSIVETVEMISTLPDEDLKNADLFINLIEEAQQLKFEKQKIMEIMIKYKQSKDIEKLDEEFQQIRRSIRVDNPETDENFRKTKNKIKMLLEIDPETYRTQLNSADDNECITEATINEICPLTKQTIKNAVRNKICNHIYEKSAILQLIDENPNIRCAMVGCKNKRPIRITDIEDDVLFSRMLKLNNKEL